MILRLTNIDFDTICLVPKQRLCLFCYRKSDTNLWYAAHYLLGIMAVVKKKTQLENVITQNFVKLYMSRVYGLREKPRNALMASEDLVSCFLNDNFSRTR